MNLINCYESVYLIADQATMRLVQLATSIQLHLGYKLPDKFEPAYQHAQEHPLVIDARKFFFFGGS